MFKINVVTRTIITMTLVLSIAMNSTASAWDQVAHFFIAREAAAQRNDLPKPDPSDLDELPVENYANLPDYVPSQMPMGTVVGLNPYFCWSHGVQGVQELKTDTWPYVEWTTGDEGGVTTSKLPIPVAIEVPQRPEYANDSRYPEFAMKEVLVKKLKSAKAATSSALLEMQNTINGFRAHNAADRVVHWDFMMAALEKDANNKEMSGKERGQAWIAHHVCKEAWADYLILIQKAFANNESSAFTALGAIADACPTIPKNMLGLRDGTGLPGSAELMHFAQVVYVKNGYSVEQKSTVPLVAKSTLAIRQELTSKGSESEKICRWLKQSNWATWDNEHLGDLVDNPDFTKMQEDGTPVTVKLSKPGTSRAEYDLLVQFEDNSSGYGAGDYRVWDRSVLDEKYRESITAAAAWMYSINELTPQ